MELAGPLHLVEFALEPQDLVLQLAAVGFDLGFAGAAEKAETAALTFEMGPAADKAATRPVRRRCISADPPNASMCCRLEADPAIAINYGAEVVALRGGAHLEGVTIRDIASGATRDVDTRALFIMVGAAPNTGWLSDLVALDDKGFVRTGADAGADSPFATSQPGIFAVGDIRAGSVKRVASAVGEGSVVVSKRHMCNSSHGETWWRKRCIGTRSAVSGRVSGVRTVCPTDKGVARREAVEIERDMGGTTLLDATVVWPCAARLGEGPIWLSGSGELCFVDIKQGHLLSLTPATGDRQIFDLGGSPSFAVPLADGALLVGNGRDLVRVER
eukprot:gene37929-51222_t